MVTHTYLVLSRRTLRQGLLEDNKAKGRFFAVTVPLGEGGIKVKCFKSQQTRPKHAVGDPPHFAFVLTS